jgi:hypothetical protein
MTDRDDYRTWDLGALRVRVPAEATLRMADPGAPFSGAVYFAFAHGSVRLSVFAAPRGGKLWPARAQEIATTRAELGDNVCSFNGEWGRELRISDAASTNWVIGVDGPRWMLLGRSTCDPRAGTELADTMRDMLRACVVFRGHEPLPVWTPLPLREPGSAGPRPETALSTAPYAGTVRLVLPEPRTPMADDRSPLRSGSGTPSHAPSGSPPAT